MSATTVQVPVTDDFRRLLLTDREEAALSRWSLEALVVEAVRDRIISRGYGAELLGLGFHESEELYARRGVVYDFSEEELAAELRGLTDVLAQP